MTRVNVVHPSELTGPHLVAEYRELPRIFGLVRRLKREPVIPPTYRLGKGHCTFFYDKLRWLTIRQNALVAEMLNRGYQPNHLSLPMWTLELDPKFYGDYTPTADAIRINRARIQERLSQ